MWSYIFLFGSLPRRRPPEFTAILMFEFWREATATSVPGLLCLSGRRRPENVSILSSLLLWPRRSAETAQKGLETKWEGLVTILSLVSNLPKKVIPQKSFGRPPSATQEYQLKCNSRSSIPASTWGCSLATIDQWKGTVVVNSIYFYRYRQCCALYSRLRYSIQQIFLAKVLTNRRAPFTKARNGPLIFKRRLLSFSSFWKSTQVFILAFVTSKPLFNKAIEE